MLNCALRHFNSLRANNWNGKKWIKYKKENGKRSRLY